MPQVSKRILPPHRHTKMLNLLFLAFSDISNKKQAGNVLAELLTETEKIMFAKRLACFYLLERGVGLVDIENTINISRASAFYYKTFYANSPQLQKFIQKSVHRDKVKNLIEDVVVEVLHGQLRPGADWSYSRSTYYEHKRRRQKKF